MNKENTFAFSMGSKFLDDAGNLVASQKLYFSLLFKILKSNFYSEEHNFVFSIHQSFYK
jgi:hypothetical protein